MYADFLRKKGNSAGFLEAVVAEWQAKVLDYGGEQSPDELTSSLDAAMKRVETAVRANGAQFLRL
jgi:hypothetical protein